MNIYQKVCMCVCIHVVYRCIVYHTHTHTRTCALIRDRIPMYIHIPHKHLLKRWKNEKHEQFTKIKE